ncbi:hypothetical protein SAMN02745172_02813 [Pseudoxanthobacter soli DSM 19599]|uniref:Uncharacterized protein n=1 Tax=Pseudoxanthobacter soli DSM 19599 TaxID=1123029 RepID=A0A1M7ZMM8_9HYPH|nr:hypothetical protein [Pseudoxanthobacter soli]SHO66158.1 hypothetical protein SAMN02745172_02813 [Pseudoxanthobacter soli DSM 19599]
MTAIQSVTSQPNQPAPPWTQAAVAARDLAVAAPVSVTSATSTALYTPTVEGSSETTADAAVKNTEISTRLSPISSQVTTAISNAVLNTSSSADAGSGVATADHAGNAADIQQLRQPAAQPSALPSTHGPDGFAVGDRADASVRDTAAAGAAGTDGNGGLAIGEDGPSPYPWLEDSGDTPEPSGDAVAVFGWQLPALPPPSVSDVATTGAEDIGLAAVVAAIEEAARMPSRFASDTEENMPSAIRKMANYLREEIARRRDQISDDTSTMVKINRNIENYYEFSGNLIVMGDGGRYSSGHFSVLNKLTGDLMYAHYGNGTLRYYGTSPNSLTAATMT